MALHSQQVLTERSFSMGSDGREGLVDTFTNVCINHSDLWQMRGLQGPGPARDKDGRTAARECIDGDFIFGHIGRLLAEAEGGGARADVEETLKILCLVHA